MAETKEHESNQILEFTREIKNKSMEFRLKIIEAMKNNEVTSVRNDLEDLLVY